MWNLEKWYRMAGFQAGPLATATKEILLSWSAREVATWATKKMIGTQDTAW